MWSSTIVIRIATKEIYVSLRRSALAFTAVAGLAMSAALTVPAVAATSATPAAPAGVAAAYPTTPVNFGDGAGSSIKGTLTWYNRSVAFSGNLTSSGCRRAWFSAYAGNQSLGPRSSSTHCNTVTPVPVTLPADVVGGGTDVLICIDNEWAEPLKCVDYPRPRA